MLFIVNANGVPSVAPFVALAGAVRGRDAADRAGEPDAPPAASGAATLTWAAATDNVGVAEYNVYRSTAAGFTPRAANLVGSTAATSFTDTGLAAGTYYYVVRAVGRRRQHRAGVGGGVGGRARRTRRRRPCRDHQAAGGDGRRRRHARPPTASDDVGVAGVQFCSTASQVGGGGHRRALFLRLGQPARSPTARTRWPPWRATRPGNVTTSPAVTVTVAKPPAAWWRRTRSTRGRD